MANIRQEQTQVLGFIDGYVCKYNTSTSITIIAGSCEANSSYYSLASDDSHSMTGLTVGFRRHYIYIDDDASTPPAATIIDATTPPSWSNSKRGWYNGDDRCIGEVSSSIATATIDFFETSGTGKVISNYYGFTSLPPLASNMNPDGTWQTPDDAESSTILPINVVEGYFGLQGADAASNCSAAVTTSETATVYTAINGAMFFDSGYNLIDLRNIRLPLGASHNVKVGGGVDDDNDLDLRLHGYSYAR